MERREFEKLVEEGFAAIPEEFRNQVKNVALIVEEYPSREVLKEQGLSLGETLFGLYRGIPNTERGSTYGVGATFPDTITLYRGPIEEEAGADKEYLKEIVHETVWHEVGHFLGLSERQIREKEDARAKGRGKRAR